MQFDEAKTYWNTATDSLPPALEANHLQLTWQHPALRALQRQLLWEIICWTLIGILGYTGLDGDQRPVGYTIVLATGLGLLLLHAVVGYRLAARPVTDRTVIESLHRRIESIQSFSRLSIFLRTAAVLALFIFLTSGVTVWGTDRHLWSIAGVLAGTALLLYVQYRVWRKRLNRLRETLDSLAAT